MGLFAILKDQPLLNEQLLYQSWLSIPLPVWDSTLNEFEWEALGILTDWSHPNVLRVYICNATGSMRQELWEAVQDIKCEEYLDPHLLHPTILQIVYMKWWAAMAVVEDLAAARTKRFPLEELSTISEFVLTTVIAKCNAEFSVRLKSMTGAIARMASTHAKLLLAKTQSHRDIQNQFDLNCELFVNLGLRGKEYFEKVKAYLEAEQRSPGMSDNGELPKRSQKIPQTIEELAESILDSSAAGQMRQLAANGDIKEVPRHKPNICHVHAEGLSAEIVNPDESDDEDSQGSQTLGTSDINKMPAPEEIQTQPSAAGLEEACQKVPEKTLDKDETRPRGEQTQIPRPKGHNHSTTNLVARANTLTQKVHSLSSMQPVSKRSSQPRRLETPREQPPSLPKPTSPPGSAAIHIPREHSVLPSTTYKPPPKQPRRHDSPTYSEAPSHSRKDSIPIPDDTSAVPPASQGDSLRDPAPSIKPQASVVDQTQSQSFKSKIPSVPGTPGTSSVTPSSANIRETIVSQNPERAPSTPGLSVPPNPKLKHFAPPSPPLPPQSSIPRYTAVYSNHGIQTPAARCPAALQPSTSTSALGSATTRRNNTPSPRQGSRSLPNFEDAVAPSPLATRHPSQPSHTPPPPPSGLSRIPAPPPIPTRIPSTPSSGSLRRRGRSAVRNRNGEGPAGGSNNTAATGSNQPSTPRANSDAQSNDNSTSRGRGNAQPSTNSPPHANGESDSDGSYDISNSWYYYDAEACEIRRGVGGQQVPPSDMHWPHGQPSQQEQN
ncbi:hypothetical protein IWZ00DRAFT_562236 [Phyllosticta capitalensis]